MKPVLALIHDSVGQTSLIGGTILILLKRIENKDINTDDLIKYLNNIKQYNHNLNEIIDKFYKENERGESKDTTERIPSTTRI